jgi:hypothetical protein
MGIEGMDHQVEKFFNFRFEFEFLNSHITPLLLTRFHCDGPRMMQALIFYRIILRKKSTNQHPRSLFRIETQGTPMYNSALMKGLSFERLQFLVLPAEGEARNCLGAKRE